MNSGLVSMRQDEVYNYIARSNVATVQEISSALRISQSTIRRDIKALEEHNRVVSFHGGVSANSGYGSFTERTSQNIEEKHRIAQTAADMVVDHDFLYIGGGSSTFEFSRALSSRGGLRDVTVVCSAMNIARSLTKNKAFKIIMPGGELRAEDESMVSKTTIDTLGTYNFTKAFVGSQAINAKNGYTIPRFDLKEVKQVMVTNSKELVLLCDHTKIGKISPYRVCDADRISVLITDEYLENEDELKEIERCGVKVVRV